MYARIVGPYLHTMPYRIVEYLPMIQVQHPTPAYTSQHYYLAPKILTGCHHGQPFWRFFFANSSLKYLGGDSHKTGHHFFDFRSNFPEAMAKYINKFHLNRLWKKPSYFATSQYPKRPGKKPTKKATRENTCPKNHWTTVLQGSGIHPSDLRSHDFFWWEKHLQTLSLSLSLLGRSLFWASGLQTLMGRIDENRGHLKGPSPLTWRIRRWWMGLEKRLQPKKYHYNNFME